MSAANTDIVNEVTESVKDYYGMFLFFKNAIPYTNKLNSIFLSQLSTGQVIN